MSGLREFQIYSIRRRNGPARELRAYRDQPPRSFAVRWVGCLYAPTRHLAERAAHGIARSLHGHLPAGIIVTRDGGVTVADPRNVARRGYYDAECRTV